jgi:pyruvate,water dikinase
MTANNPLTITLARVNNSRVADVDGKNASLGELISNLRKSGIRVPSGFATTAVKRKSPVLEDGEILTLARWAAIVEKHYGCHMDMEWGRDGDSGEMFMLQARPETVQSQSRQPL